jgi:hypothetical protein
MIRDVAGKKDRGRCETVRNGARQEIYEESVETSYQMTAPVRHPYDCGMDEKFGL